MSKGQQYREPLKIGTRFKIAPWINPISELPWVHSVLLKWCKVTLNRLPLNPIDFTRLALLLLIIGEQNKFSLLFLTLCNMNLSPI